MSPIDRASGGGGRSFRDRDGGEDLARHEEAVLAILTEVDRHEALDENQLNTILRRHPRNGDSVFSKRQLVRTYRHLCETGRMAYDQSLQRKIQMKPVRTISGVAPVTVLTKPFPCPGECIFCPTDARMPKSYLRNEPAAMRADLNGFDPYAQTATRMESLAANGHPIEKIELLVLGGTWSSYPREYQESFLRRCFDAMNGRIADSIEEAHAWNEVAAHRNVGLVIETRPDLVTPDEIGWMRRLGVTKVQIGAQSTDDRILDLNRRGHSVEQTRQAVDRLRAAGFKVVLHWMPNLHGATPACDLADFARLWSDEGLRPDEIKIYSTVLLENSDLYRYWERGEYRPYPEEELIDLIIDCKQMVPAYCRINRLYRDIPSTSIVAGSKMSNMRQQVQRRMRWSGLCCRCIRCREVRGDRLQEADLRLDDLAYRTRTGEERFLSFHDAEDRLAGYARLSLPDRPGFAGRVDLGIPDLEGAALIREVHVYGPALELGQISPDRAQHRGLGTRLLAAAEDLARGRGYPRMAIIAAVGTRPYYAKRGYERAGTYMVRSLA